MAKLPLVDLGTIADLRSGGTPSRSDPDLWGESLPWVSGKDFRGFYCEGATESLSTEGEAIAATVDAGATLMLVRGMMLARRIPVMLACRKVAFNQDVRAIVPHDGVDPTFLAYAIQARATRLRSYVTYAGHGTARLESDFIKALPLWLPALDEQLAITRVLSTFDDTLLTLKHQIYCLTQRFRTLCDRLTSGSVRISRHAEHEWTESKLGTLFADSKSRGRGGLPTLSVTMNNGLVRRDTLDRRMSDGLSPEDHLLARPRDIVYNTMRMWQGASGLCGEEGLVSPAYVVQRPTELIDPRFAAFWFKSSRMIYLFWAYSYGLTGDRLRLYSKDFAAIPVTHPTSLSEQSAIADILDTAQREIEQLDQLREQIQLQKRGLMQKLLTGEIRVPADEPGTEEVSP